MGGNHHLLAPLLGSQFHGLGKDGYRKGMERSLRLIEDKDGIAITLPEKGCQMNQQLDVPIRHPGCLDRALASFLDKTAIDRISAGLLERKPLEPWKGLPHEAHYGVISFVQIALVMKIAQSRP